jgi:hypothetical protein
MKKVLAAIACFLFVLSFVLASPSLSAQKSSAAVRTQPVSITTSTLSPGLSSALNDLDRISSATEADIANMGDGGDKNDRSWKNAWRFWHPFSSSRSSHDERAAASLQRNLHDAMPGLILDARTSGSFAATFKLYNNLSVVCELLDTLVKSSRSQGGKSDTALANDSAAMGRVRQDLASYVEQTAAALDARTQYAATTSASPGKPSKKIVVYDTVPVKKSAKKTAATPPQ